MQRSVEATSEITRIQGRGQITLPHAIRKAAGIKAGDVVAVKVVGPGQVELHTLPSVSLVEFFERFPIEGPIDEAADREAWQDVAAQDVLGE